MKAHLIKQPQYDVTYLWQAMIRAFRLVLGSLRSSLSSSCVPSAPRFDWDLRQTDVIILLGLLEQGLGYGTYIRILCWRNALRWNWWSEGIGALRVVSAFRKQSRNCRMGLTAGLKAGKGSCC